MALNQERKTRFCLSKMTITNKHKNDRISRLSLSVKMSSERDKAILNSILNPFLPLGSDFDTGDDEKSKEGNFFFVKLELYR